MGAACGQRSEANLHGIHEHRRPLVGQAVCVQQEVDDDTLRDPSGGGLLYGEEKGPAFKEEESRMPTQGVDEARVKA